MLPFYLICLFVSLFNTHMHGTCKALDKHTHAQKTKNYFKNTLSLNLLSLTGGSIVKVTLSGSNAENVCAFSMFKK